MKLLPLLALGIIALPIMAEDTAPTIVGLSGDLYIKKKNDPPPPPPVNPG